MRALAVASATALMTAVIPLAAASASEPAGSHGPSAAVHASGAITAQPAAGGTLAAARLAARRTGRAVPVPSMTTQTSSTVALPDGKFQMTTSVMPVRVRQDGRWVAISATLHRVAGGYAPAATPSGLVLSAGGRGPLALMTTSAGRRLSLSVPFALPAPVVSAATATYRNVLPGVDLKVTASSQGGITDSLVIKTAAAARNPAVRGFKTTSSASGLTLRAGAAGNAIAAASDGSGFVLPAPQVKLATVLAAPRLSLPVSFASVVNPASSGTEGYVETQQGCPTYLTYNVAQANGEGIGYQNSPGTACEGLYRSFWQLNTTNLNSSMVISSATLLTAETFGSDLTCSHTWPATLKWTGGIGTSTDWNTQPGILSTLGTASPKTAWCGTQDVDFNVTSAMQTTAAANDKQWTYGLYGDESQLSDSSCSPSSEYNCGFMRFNNNPSVTTVFDIAPSVPTNTNTTPQSHNDGTVTGPGCGSSAIGWIGKTDIGSGNGSSVTMNQTLVSNVTGEHVRGDYMIWDNDAPNDPVGSNVVATPDGAYVASGTTEGTPVGIALKDGHAYGWRVRADDGTLQSSYAPDCHFNVDLSAPTVPTVASTTFPASGSPGATPPVAGTAGTFSFTSTDPVPTGCVSTCVHSGVAYFEYSFNTPIPTSGATTVAAGGTVSYTASLWGTNVLYVAAVDNAGNVSQARQYDFYVKWNPQAKVTAGDVDGDGIPDLLATDTKGDLLLFKGGSDPAAATTTEIAGTAASTPAGGGWNSYQFTHRGSFSEGGVDDLIAHKQGGSDLYLYLNHQNDPGVAPQFGDTSDIDTFPAKPGCAATASDSSNCTGYDASDWSGVSQVLIPGDVYGTGLPDLLTVENDQLWLYQYDGAMDTPVLLGSSGWNGMTLVAPGNVGGQLTLWARGNSTGTIYSWPLRLDSNGVPELGSASVGAPVTATSGTVVSGVSLTAAGFPSVVSSGPLTGGTCGSSDLTACPGIYAKDPQGNLWYYEGQSTASGASPLSGSRLLVGNVDAPMASLPLSEGSGVVANDATGNGYNAALGGTASWATDPARGTVLSLDGSSGYLELPASLVEGASDLSFSLWFKTSAPGEVLLSTGHTVPGASPPGTGAMPVLYVGTDGKLYGQFWTDVVDPMVSGSAVDDGAWHHVVISAGDDTQSLYLDGQLVGSMGGALDNIDPLEFVGAGYVNGEAWVNAPASGYSYFDGEVSDVEFYGYALNPDEVTSLYHGQGDITQLG
jgi:Concanavalin A-like lectin/glucanases superfamily